GFPFPSAGGAWYNGAEALSRRRGREDGDRTHPPTGVLERLPDHGPQADGRDRPTPGPDAGPDRHASALPRLPAARLRLGQPTRLLRAGQPTPARLPRRLRGARGGGNCLARPDPVFQGKIEGSPLHMPKIGPWWRKKPLISWEKLGVDALNN